MPTTPPNVTRMIDCLKQQKDCYSQLLQMAHRQQKAIESENDDELSLAMEAKKPMLLALQKLEEEMQPVLQNMPEADRKIMIQQSGKLKDNTANTLKQLIAVEDECAQLLSDKKDKTFEQMKTFRETQKGIKGYSETGGKSSRFSRKG